MKKWIALILTLVMAMSLVACSSAPKETDGGDEPKGNEDQKIAIVCETVGTELFLTQVVEAAKAAEAKYGFQLSVMECADDDAFTNNATAAVQEGYNLILGIGWRSANAISSIATDYPDAAEYAIIDSVVENENVTCIDFKEWEAAYVMGAFIASCFPEDKLIGYQGAMQNQGMYEYQWGFEQGVKSVTPDAELMVSFCDSYSDPVKAKEQSARMFSQGCRFIYGGAASSDEGIYALALEHPGEIFSNGQDADNTTEENPYILSSQLKNTGECTTYVLDHYFAGTLEDGVSTLGLAEGAVGVVHVTTESANYRNMDVVTDEAIAAGQKAVDDIVSGAVVLEVPALAS